MDDNVAKDVVVSSRIRLARNYRGMPFPQRLNDINAVKKLIVAADKSADFEHDIIFMDRLDDIDRAVLMENHLISPDLADKTLGALILSKDKSISIMVNEEDHIRAQCILDGYNLEECYQRINHFDDRLSEQMPIAYDSEFGYLTACLTNVGTGMRASVMLFLPAMTIFNYIDKYIGLAKDAGLTVRGVYGEGSKTTGCLYQISNAFAMGRSEQQLIENVKETVEAFCAVEQGLRKEKVADNKVKFVDNVYRAYGILRNARVLSSSEFMEHMAMLKFGIVMNVIDFKNIEMLDKLVIEVQPANLLQSANKQKLSVGERDVLRAHWVRQQIEKMGMVELV